ncbi:hypothetical protein X729_00605 [Mesorhizobium sp. L103C131B0]|nr:hypothetical protein X729_00605 [Mesorhizobium sp. L103C131B0]
MTSATLHVRESTTDPIVLNGASARRLPAALFLGEVFRAFLRQTVMVVIGM